MAGRSGTSLKKRQKELARQDRQRDKEAMRGQRKNEKPDRPPGSGPEISEASALELFEDLSGS